MTTERKSDTQDYSKTVSEKTRPASLHDLISRDGASDFYVSEQTFRLCIYVLTSFGFTEVQHGRGWANCHLVTGAHNHHCGAVVTAERRERTAPAAQFTMNRDSDTPAFPHLPLFLYTGYSETFKQLLLPTTALLEKPCSTQRSTERLFE